MSEAMNELLNGCLEKGRALKAALTLFDWDSATASPKEADENTAKMVGVLSDLYYNAYINDETRDLMKKAEKESLTAKEKAILRELKRYYEQMETIPPEEYRAFSELTAKSVNIWSRAKDENDFSAFAPVLKEIIEYRKKYASYRMKGEENKTAYDILLDDFEPGFNQEKYDAFFETLKKELVPFIRETVKKAENVDKSFIYQPYDVEKQKKLCHFLAEYIGFDFERGVLEESAHPFTTQLHNKDVRITDHYYEKSLESAIFSVIHESGHALYELQVADDITLTIVGEGTSMGIHESQSRFFENIIGRSEAFWKPLYPKLLETFPEQLKGISLEQFIKAVNKPECGPIRTEADELTYALHILIRYELEKMIFEDKASVDELPELWKQKYEELLGVKPSTDAEGVLQDVHWAGGDFGYFPSYALGSAIAAQIYRYMKKNMPVEKYLEEENLAPIRDFLKENIHKFGKMKNTDEILKDMTGEEFNPQYYIDYLKEKYQALYD